jgi:hypothetical protein
LLNVPYAWAWQVTCDTFLVPQWRYNTARGGLLARLQKQTIPNQSKDWILPEYTDGMFYVLSRTCHFSVFCYTNCMFQTNMQKWLLKCLLICHCLTFTC